MKKINKILFRIEDAVIVIVASLQQPTSYSELQRVLEPLQIQVFTASQSVQLFQHLYQRIYNCYNNITSFIASEYVRFLRLTFRQDRIVWDKIKSYFAQVATKFMVQTKRDLEYYILKLLQLKRSDFIRLLYTEDQVASTTFMIKIDLIL